MYRPAPPHYISPVHLTAGILIGGQSRRMGRPKALIQLAGQTLIERTVDLASQFADRVILLGTPAFDLPPNARTYPMLPDSHPNVGPIGGLASLLSAAGRDPALLLACDMPRLTAPLLDRLIGALHCDHDAIAFATAPPPHGWHPCCAIYMPSAARTVADRIAAGHFALQPLLAALRTHTIHLDPADADQLANLNTPADCVNMPAVPE